VRRTVTVVLLSALVLALASCGGSGSSSGAEGTTTSAVTTDTTATTEAASTDTTSGTDTTATSTVVNAGETATWRGDAFTVSDVETGYTAPVADLLGEKQEAENGVWLSLRITPAEDNSGPWSSEFAENMQIKGGDGVVYQDSLHNNGGEQDFKGEGDFLVWIDIPEAAVSGAVLEIFDGLHTVDPDPSNPYVDPVPDPAYATRVNLGL
jgi:hypothetical protein